MNKKLYLLFFVTVVALSSVTLGENKPKFSWKAYGNVANYFENENDFISFFDFHKNDVIAEIGAGHGENMCGFNLITDSVTFYVQDIDTVALSEANFEKVVKRCKKSKKPFTNTFYRCIGTEKSSQLPDSTFDKIILSATFHEFSFMDEMIADIYKKLKPAGQLYILESHCFSETHENYTADETIEIMKKHNFTLVKKDGKDLNKSTGLYRMIFKKN